MGSTGLREGQSEGVVMERMRMAGAASSWAWDLAGPARPFTHLTGSLTKHFRKSSRFPYFL